MKILNIAQIDIFALFILSLIFINIYYRLDMYLAYEKVFVSLIICNALILILNMILWNINGKIGTNFRNANLILTSFYYILIPIPCVLGSFYVNFKVYKNKNYVKSIILPFTIPICANAFLSILSCFYGFLFYFDKNNYYYRGRIYPLMIVVCYLYLIYSLMLIILRKNEIDKNEFKTLLISLGIPFLCGFLQVTFYGTCFLWPAMTIALLIVFVNTQNDELYKDHLTGLNNRRQLDIYLKYHMKNNSKDNLLAGIMVDLDSFKQINDTYGHIVGDRALKDTAEILKKSFRKDDFIARYGGDEFVAIIQIDNEENLKKIVDRINTNVEKLNKEKRTLYEISLSIGYGILDYKSEMTEKQFINYIDKLMYKKKSEKKNLFTKC